jgi:hypothetical protein
MHCISCGVPLLLYWLKDEVWTQVRGTGAPPEGGFSLCLGCAEKRLGRRLTLDDLGIGKYQLTAGNMPNRPDFMKEYARATVYGACEESKVPTPAAWQRPADRPHTDALAVGASLARQTLNASSLLPQLILEVNRWFP